MRLVEHLAGCLYVLEGSRLGGKVIARSVREHLGLTAERGCSFFAGRDEPEKRWLEVVAWLERVAVEAAIDPQAVVDASAETFRSLGRRLAAVGALL